MRGLRQPPPRRASRGGGRRRRPTGSSPPPTASAPRCRTSSAARPAGTRQLARMPGEAELARPTARRRRSDYVEEEAGQRATARGMLATVERHARRGALLDLGCWVGFLARRGPRPWLVAGRRRRAERVRLGVRARAPRPRRAHRGPAHRRPARGPFDAVVLGRRHRAPARPGRGAGPHRRAARPGRRRRPDPARRGQPPRPGDGRALVVGHPDPRAVLHPAQPGDAAHPPRVRAALGHARRRRRSASATTSSASAGTRRRVARLLVRAATAAGLADRMWAPDFRDRMLVIARGPGATAR